MGGASPPLWPPLCVCEMLARDAEDPDEGREHKVKTLPGWAITASLLAAVVVTVMSLLQTPIYEASALVLVDVGPPGPVRPVLLAAPEPEILRELAHTRAAVIDSRPVAEEAIRRSGLDMTPGMLLTNLAVEPVGAAQFLRLSYTDTDPERAREIVNRSGG